MLTRAKFGKVTPKSKRWILYGLLAALFYAFFQYVCGLYKGNAISGKVVSSYIAILGALAIEFYQYRLKKKSKNGR